MDSLLDPVELNRETTQTLDQIRSGAENVLYGTSSAEAETNLNRLVLPLIEGSGLPNLQVMHYRWFLRELARLWRTRNGRDLAFHLELCIRKWINLGLETRTLQFLVCEAHQRLKGQDSTTKTQSHEGADPESSTANRQPSAAESAESAQSADVLSEATSATSASSAVLRSGTTQSVESAESVDVPSPETAKPGSDSATGILDSSNPGPLSSSTPGVPQ